MDKEKTYLLDDVEVIFTGRVAKRQLKNNKTDERYEVKPSDSAFGSWKKWVRITDLYEIEEDD